MYPVSLLPRTETPATLYKFCLQQGIPLLSSPVDAAYLIDAIRIYLSRRYAQKPWSMVY
ncbi:hypothetical protein OURE66S_03252 [Oligella ureolytica]